jgi:serine protease AprX
MKRTLLVFLFSAFIFGSKAQYTRYVIRLKDKVGTPYTISNPIQYLSQRSIDRRVRQHIPIDVSDLPITPRYIDSIRLAGNVTVLNVSKWLNQVCIYTTDAAALSKINSFPFVLAEQPVRRPVQQGVPANKFGVPGDGILSPGQVNSNYFDYGASYEQIHIHQGEFLHNYGFIGKGMEIAILDAGFLGYLTNPLLDSIRLNNQIKETWDYVDNESSVNEDYFHGMHCLSIMSVDKPGQMVGSCPKADFYLYRTEDVSSESPLEEQNWVAAAEHADSIGVDVISTSLGYTQFDFNTFDHTYADMNGKTTIIARGHAMAANKGIVCVAAAGNDGADAWHYIGTPADADSIITVGAVNTSGLIADFSSYGPTSDGRVKPDACSVGWGTTLASTSGTVSTGNGTSYAAPNMAGLTTCLWQAFQEVTNIDIINAVRASGSLYPSHDDHYGFGIPDLKKAFVILTKKVYTQQAQLANCKAEISWTGKIGPGMTFALERKLPGESAFSTVYNPSSTPPQFLPFNYSYSDDLTSIHEDNIKYRVKQIIGSDTTFYFDEMTVNSSSSCLTVVIEPNPVGSSVSPKVSLTAAGKITFIIFNRIGQKMYSSSAIQQAGTQVYNLPFNRAAKGAYILKVLLDDKRLASIKFIK